MPEDQARLETSNEAPSRPAPDQVIQTVLDLLSPSRDDMPHRMAARAVGAMLGAQFDPRQALIGAGAAILEFAHAFNASMNQRLQEAALASEEATTGPAEQREPS